MNAGWFSTYHEIPELVQNWLAGLGVRDPERGRAILPTSPGGLAWRIGIRWTGSPFSSTRSFRDVPTPSMALTNLERFLAAVPRLDRTLAELAGDPRTTEILLQVFSTSQYYSEVLIRDPELFDWLQTGADLRDRTMLVDQLWETLSALTAEEEQKLALRRFRQRESLRIGYNDIVRGFPLELITQDLSHLADACVEGAVRLARRALRRGSAIRRHRGARPLGSSSWAWESSGASS